MSVIFNDSQQKRHNNSGTVAKYNGFIRLLPHTGRRCAQDPTETTTACEAVHKKYCNDLKTLILHELPTHMEKCKLITILPLSFWYVNTEKHTGGLHACRGRASDLIILSN